MGSLPQEWRMVKLGVCLQRRKETVMPATLLDRTVGLVGLEDIQDGGRGGVTIRKSSPRVIESLKTRFRSGDILYGKLRPYLNKVGIAGEEGLCSTEIWAFTASAFIEPRYAAFFLASASFVNRIASLTKGANLPRLDAESFDAVDIPVPPLSEQRRIVELLQEAEGIRKLGSEGAVKTATLIPALFARSFGDLARFPVQPLGSVLQAIETGWSPRALDTPIRGNGWGVLKLSAVTSGRYFAHENKALPADVLPEQHLEVHPGDVLLSRKNTRDLVGACVFVWETVPRLVFPDLVFRLVLKPRAPIIPHYLWALLASPGFNLRVRRLADGAAGSMPNIPKHRLEKLPIPIPPRMHQEAFSRIATLAHQAELDVEASRATCKEAVASLSAHAFSGQMTASWRKAHRDQLTLEAGERDACLREARPALPRLQSETIEDWDRFLELPTDGIYAELNREQRQLLRDIERMVGGVLYARYFSARQLGEHSLAHGPLRRNPHLIEGHLAVLAARGLIIPVSREEQTEDTGEFVFGNAYRLPLMHYEPPDGVRG